MRYNHYICNMSLPLYDVMNMLEKRTTKIIYVLDDEQRLCGSITDGDIRRYAVVHHSLDGKAGEIMHHPCIHAVSIEQAKLLLIKHSITSVPIVDEAHKITDILFALPEDRRQCVSPKDTEIAVVMMAGGKGERLYPLTAVLPKPLIPIHGIPIAQRILTRFLDVGLHRFILSLNYKKNMIKSYFDDVMQSADFTYIEEETPMGTAGSLCLMRDLLVNDFIVTNCDTLIDIDLLDLIAKHRFNGNVLTVVSAFKKIKVPYGVLQLSAQGDVESLHEKPDLHQFINSGMYIASPAIFSFFPKRESFHMTDVLEVCLTQKQKVGTYIIKDDAFMDMGQPDELQQMQERLI